MPVAESYLEHAYNIRIRSSQSLSAFMENQLAELKAKMERSSQALSEFERELNVINPEEKTSILSARLLQLNTEYTNAQADRVRKEAGWESVRNGAIEAAQASDQSQDLRLLCAKSREERENIRRDQSPLWHQPSGIPQGMRHRWPKFRRSSTRPARTLHPRRSGVPRMR